MSRLSIPPGTDTCTLEGKGLMKLVGGQLVVQVANFDARFLRAQEESERNVGYLGSCKFHEISRKQLFRMIRESFLVGKRKNPLFLI